MLVGGKRKKEAGQWTGQAQEAGERSLIEQPSWQVEGYGVRVRC